MSKLDFVIFIPPHGGPPKGNLPETATILAWQDEFTYEEFGEMLSEFKGVKFKINTTACYGGGIHSIARKLDNVCTSAIVPYFTKSSSGIWERHLFIDGVSDHLINNSTASFASTSLAGFAKDDANQNQGRLSSFDYVDFILKKGPYEKSRAERPQSWEMINGKNVYSSHLPSDWNSQQPPDAEIFSSMLNHQTLEADICQNCCSKGVQSDLDKITILAQTLNEVSQQAVNQDLGRKADLQPAQVRTVFHEVINDMKKNGARYLQIAKMYEDKYRDLVRRWNQHKEKFKNAGDWRSEGDSRAKIQREFDTLKTDAERNLKKYSFNHQMLLRLERLDEFSKKATPEQKKKFVQLLQCEWEPL